MLLLLGAWEPVGHTLDVSKHIMCSNSCMAWRRSFGASLCCSWDGRRRWARCAEAGTVIDGTNVHSHVRVVWTRALSMLLRVRQQMYNKDCLLEATCSSTNKVQLTAHAP
jgi:hypothetical protein